MEMSEADRTPVWRPGPDPRAGQEQCQPHVNGLEGTTNPLRGAPPALRAQVDCPGPACHQKPGCPRFPAHRGVGSMRRPARARDSLVSPPSLGPRLSPRALSSLPLHPRPPMASPDTSQRRCCPGRPPEQCPPVSSGEGCPGEGGGAATVRMAARGLKVGRAERGHCGA